jgi:RND family efflux transporter MFP subunit
MPHTFARGLAFSVLVLAVVVGCRAKPAQTPEAPPAKVTVAHPVIYPVQTYMEYNGNLDAMETVQIRARVKGLLNKIEFTEGEEVKDGELLYQIDPREYEAQVAKSNADIAKSNADIANADAQIKLAETELKRVNTAVSKGVMSTSDQDKAVAQLAANRAQLDSAKANVQAGEAALKTASLNLEYTKITSPIEGRISRTLVTKGNLVGQNESTLLTTIVRMDPIDVWFEVPERDLIEYQRSLEGKKHIPAVTVMTRIARQMATALMMGKQFSPADSEVSVEVAVATEEGFPHVGKINFRDNRVEPGTGTFKIRGRLPNPRVSATQRLLYPGLYAKVRIPTGSPQPRPVIPEDALMTGQEGRFVYVVKGDDTVEKRTVTVGPQVWAPPPPGSPPEPGWSLVNPAEPTHHIPPQSMVAILQGLEAQDRVIVNGLQRARPGAKVAPDEWVLHAPSPPTAASTEKK